RTASATNAWSISPSRSASTTPWCACWRPCRSTSSRITRPISTSSRCARDGGRRVKIGVPREIKTQEYRVGLVPACVRELVAHGHEVLVERDAAAGIGFADDAYRAAGATVAATAEAVFAADLVVKVKEPLPDEIARLRAGQV